MLTLGTAVTNGVRIEDKFNLVFLKEQAVLGIMREILAKQD